ncbi:CidA/LrgA family protein [uncultured Clostridium sp.]|uniref:CidA/LrgA family protein n=1 Tax=uncultured Clostridium sp. TaxID=59620 RepID=UPI0028E8A390|nr:CidA/LrgA family protein [uncultured Clostridium sp.]
MKLLRQMGIILILCLLGELIHNIFKLPIPGNVLGMLILFIALCAGIIKIDMIDTLSKFLLDHLSFFFVPAGVGIISCMSLLKGKWFAFLSILFISAIITMVVTGWTIQLYARRTNK